MATSPVTVRGTTPRQTDLDLRPGQVPVPPAVPVEPEQSPRLRSAAKPRAGIPVAVAEVFRSRLLAEEAASRPADLH
jgi:hypothetical protein